MNIILSPLEFYEQSTNIVVAVLLRIDAVLKQVSTTKERDFVRLRQLANQAVSVYSPNLKERSQYLDKEQYAQEVMSLEESRLEFSEKGFLKTYPYIPIYSKGF
ncbi:MAG: hypothetical protein WCG45_03585 [bacterium]